ncbi:MAG: DUF4276 family protein [Candidatus Competibacteraceae bacterium]
MHLEVLVEDASGKILLDEHLLPKILGAQGENHTWRVIPYKGVGRLPKNLQTSGDPAKRILLEQLPRLLRGYGRTPGIDAVVVVVDNDKRDCVQFLSELTGLLASCDPAPNTLFRLAIEEVEAWYFGDRDALLAAYPQAKVRVLDEYVQDSLCDTWEKLADAIHPGGRSIIKKIGWPESGEVKCRWAEQIGPKMAIERNCSPSFRKFYDGLLRLTGTTINRSE